MFSSSVRKNICGCGIALCAMGSVVSHATVVQINPISSVIHTAGGYDGGGYGDLTLSGTFNVEVSGGSLIFSDYNVLVGSNPYFPISTLLFGNASYDGLNFYNQICANISCVSKSWISGIYDGNNFSLTGFYYPWGTYDMYSYSTVLNASAVPVPASAWFLGSSLIGLSGLVRRERNQS